MFTRIKLFANYIMPILFETLKLILINTILISFYLFCIQQVKFFLIDENAILEPQAYSFYLVILGFQYFLPLIKHNIEKFQEFKLIKTKTWESIYFTLLHIQIYSMILAGILLFSHLSGFYDFNLMKSMIPSGNWFFIVAINMILPGIFLYFNQRNRKIQEDSKYQHVFIIEFYLYSYITVLCVSFGILFTVPFRWDLFVGLIILNQLYITFILSKIANIQSYLNKHFFQIVLFIKRMILFELFSILTTFLHIQFGTRWITSVFFGFIFLDALILSVPYFKSAFLYQFGMKH